MFYSCLKHIPIREKDRKTHSQRLRVTYHQMDINQFKLLGGPMSKTPATYKMERPL